MVSMESRSRLQFRLGASRRLGWTLVFAAIPLFTLAQPSKSPENKLEHDFQAAMAAQDKGDLEGAKSMLLALRRQHPGIFAVDESLGMIYVAQEKYSEALPFLRAAVHEQPSSDVARANLGAALFKLHRNPEALAEFEQAARINPQNLAVQQSLGELRLDAGNPDGAASAFSAALRLKPDDSDLRLSYATALVAGKHYDQAAEALSSIPGAEQSATAQSLLAEAAEGKGDFKNAVEHYSRAVQLEPSEENAWALGVELLRHWTFDAAITEFEAAAAKFPQSTRIKLGLGAAYFGGAKYAKSIPVFADLLGTDKNNKIYAELLGMACTAVTESEKQHCSALISYAESHPTDARAATYGAAMLLTDTTTEATLGTARKLLNMALAANPKLPDAQYQMGVLKQNQGDWAGSVSNMEAAIALKPDLAQAHYRLALAFWRTGRKQDAQVQMDLQKKYSQQAEQDLSRRLRQITTFIVDVHNP